MEVVQLWRFDPAGGRRRASAIEPQGMIPAMAGRLSGVLGGGETHVKDEFKFFECEVELRAAALGPASVKIEGV